MIKLYYVRGINRFDTPYFPTLTEQANWFESLRVKTIEDNSFYPPYHQNTINISDDDASFTTAVNYLSLEYLGKTYYYFIDRISYVTDGLMTLHITMDTIQTFMFNIEWLSSQVTRRSIPRWVQDSLTTNYVINRDYVRENLSEGQFINKHYEINTGVGGLTTALVIRFISGDDALLSKITYNTDQTYQLSDGSLLICLPYPQGLTSNIKIRTIIGSTEKEYTQDEYNSIIKSILANPYAVSANIIKTDLLNITTSVDRLDPYGPNDRVVATFNYPSDSYIYGNTDTNRDLPIIVNLNINQNITTYEFNFVPNNFFQNQFNIKFCPQLLDTNYIQVFYGEKKNYTSFPIEKMIVPTIKKITINEVFSNYRFYSMNSDYINMNNYDVYNSKICVTDPINMQLISDPWREFQATNYGFERIYQAQIDQANATTLKNGLIRFFGTMPNESIAQSFKGFSSAGIAGAVVGGVSANVANTNALIDEAISNEITKDYITEKYIATKENYQYAPLTTKKANTAISALISDDVDVVFSIDEVSDIVDVAQKLEGYGYAVHENYGNVNLFTALNVRYYYNVIKCDKLEICLSGVINDNETIQNIKDRFYNGLRLWNIGGPSQDTYLFIPYHYDNIEKEFA